MNIVVKTKCTIDKWNSIVEPATISWYLEVSEINNIVEVDGRCDIFTSSGKITQVEHSKKQVYRKIFEQMDLEGESREINSMLCHPCKIIRQIAKEQYESS